MDEVLVLGYTAGIRKSLEAVWMSPRYSSTRQRPLVDISSSVTPNGFGILFDVGILLHVLANTRRIISKKVGFLRKTVLFERLGEAIHQVASHIGFLAQINCAETHKRRVSFSDQARLSMGYAVLAASTT